MIRDWKVLLIAILPALWPAASFGQIAFGVSAGFDQTNMAAQAPPANPMDARPTFHAGGVVEYSLREAIAVGVGLQVMGKGYRQTVDYDGRPANFRARPLYLQAPVKVILQGNGIYGAIGPYVGMGIGGNTQLTVEAGQNEPGERPFKEGFHFGDTAADNFTPFEFGVNIEFGYAAPNGFRLTLVCQNGFSDLRPAADRNPASGTSKTTSRSFGLGLTWLIFRN